MARTRDIRTNQLDVACDICGRTLLRGEHPEHYLAGGERRTVCDLCITRAQHEGWIRESGADDLELRHPRHEGRSLIDRFRAGRRERAAARQELLEHDGGVTRGAHLPTSSLSERRRSSRCSDEVGNGVRDRLRISYRHADDAVIRADQVSRPLHGRDDDR